VLLWLCHDLYYSPNIIWVIKQDSIEGACGTQRGKEKYPGRDLMEKTEGKRPFGILGCRWEQSTR